MRLTVRLATFTARPAQVADFLFWVAQTCWASLATLAGYRAALGHVFCLTTGHCPGTCPVLRQLMQSFKRTQPLSSDRIPSWDINLVLATLCDPKFSDDHLSLNLLTAKAVFLLALASGERRSALAAWRQGFAALSQSENWHGVPELRTDAASFGAGQRRDAFGNPAGRQE